MSIVPTLGHHALLELFGCDPAVCDDPEAVKRALHAAAAAMDTPVLGEAYHRFAPQGVSGVILIAESHVSCHSWPEQGYVAVDIYTCAGVPPREALVTLCRAFGAQSWLAQDVLRGLVEFAPERPTQRAQALFDPRAWNRALRGPGFRAQVLAVQGAVNVTGLLQGQDPEEARTALEELVREGLVLAQPPARPRLQQDWRWQSGDYALWWVLEGSALLQCIPHASRDEEIARAMVGQPITTYELAPGHLYLLRTDTTLYRTVPLGEPPQVLEMRWTRAGGVE